MFMLVSRRYERASLIATSNKPFSGWGETFGDDVVAAAMIDRLVHHAEIVALKGDSYRLRDRDLARPQQTTEQNSEAITTRPRRRRRLAPTHVHGVHFQPAPEGHLQPALTALRRRYPVQGALLELEVGM
jgi:hypothetical protein